MRTEVRINMTYMRCTKTGCHHESVRYSCLKLQVLLCATHILSASHQQTVTQTDTVRLNLLLYGAFTITFHTCSNKPVYLYRDDWCRNIYASMLLETNDSLSVKNCKTTISPLYLSGPHKGRRTYLGPTGD